LTGIRVRPDARTDLRLLTIDGAAYEMGVSRKHVQQLIERGKLKTVLVGTDRRIPVQAVLEYYRNESA
jgi:excisionase family DNA binding protein